jgi:hypothetical protein
LILKANVPNKPRKRRGDALDNLDRVKEATIIIEAEGKRPTATKIAERLGISRKSAGKHLRHPARNNAVREL